MVVDPEGWGAANSAEHQEWTLSSKQRTAHECINLADLQRLLQLWHRVIDCNHDNQIDCRQKHCERNELFNKQSKRWALGGFTLSLFDETLSRRFVSLNERPPESWLCSLSFPYTFQESYNYLKVSGNSSSPIILSRCLSVLQVLLYHSEIPWDALCVCVWVCVSIREVISLS